MDREEVVLAAMAPTDGAPLLPVQLQKLFFLIDKRAAHALGGPYFNFQPYHYGPFDKVVYQTVEGLARGGLAEVTDAEAFGTKTYRVTPEGLARGRALLGGMSPSAQAFLTQACQFVRNTPFSQLVSAIYKEYPEMRANSIFRD